MRGIGLNHTRTDDYRMGPIPRGVTVAERFSSRRLPVRIRALIICPLWVINGSRRRHLGCPLLAEAVEKVGCQVAREIAGFFLQGTNGTRGHLRGSTSRQERVCDASANPFVSMMRDIAQWARNFVRCAFRRLFQHPQPMADIQENRIVDHDTTGSWRETVPRLRFPRTAGRVVRGLRKCRSNLRCESAIFV